MFNFIYDSRLCHHLILTAKDNFQGVTLVHRSLILVTPVRAKVMVLMLMLPKRQQLIPLVSATSLNELVLLSKASTPCSLSLRDSR